MTGTAIWRSMRMSAMVVVEDSLPETETVSVTMNDSQARNDHEGVPQGPCHQRMIQDS